MTHSSPRPSFSVGFAALALGSLACAAQPAARPSEPRSASVAPRREAEPAAAPAVRQPSEDGPSETDETADNVVTLIAKPGLWPLDVEAARRVLQAFGPVTREQRSPHDLSLVGGPYGALDRFDIAYSLDDKQYWVFGSAGFVLDDRDPARLYRALEARLTELLGKPEHAALDEAGAGARELPPVVWDMGEALLSLAPSTDHGEEVVLIAIRENDKYSE